jgi:hypothetical protein
MNVTAKCAADLGGSGSALSSLASGLFETVEEHMGV